MTETSQPDDVGKTYLADSFFRVLLYRQGMSVMQDQCSSVLNDSPHLILSDRQKKVLKWIVDACYLDDIHVHCYEILGEHAKAGLIRDFISKRGRSQPPSL